ncbi:MAG: aldo/keto reductase [Bacteroidetes bacterium]|nr:aldo/keto reductase [Bacteroidota bacterium]
MTPALKTSKLALGTVQFGFKYGISNTYGQTSLKEIGEILKLAFDNGIRTIDTARHYGTSEENLGNFKLDDYNIVSKYFDTNDEKTLRQSLDESLKSLKQKSLYGYIAHSTSTLFEHPELWDILNQLKAEGLVQKIGASMYAPQELKMLLDKKMVPDLIQIPFNIIDNRFEPYFPILKSYGTEIHTRSAFLQGIFFMDYNKLNSYFSELVPFLKELNSNFPDSNSKAGFLLNHCVSNNNIDKVVIGVNNAEQLSQNINSLQQEIPSVNFSTDLRISEKILLPSNWPQN